MAQLTRTELLSLPEDTKIYEGVGKMWVFFFPVFFLRSFSQTPLFRLPFMRVNASVTVWSNSIRILPSYPCDIVFTRLDKRN